MGFAPKVQNRSTGCILYDQKSQYLVFIGYFSCKAWLVSCKVNGTYLSGKAKSGTDTFKNLGFLIYFMKIMKAFDKKVGEAEYHKYRINLPKKIVEESNLLGTVAGPEVILTDIIDNYASK